MRTMKLAIVLGLVCIAFAKETQLVERDDILGFLHSSLQECYEDDAKTIKVDITDAAFESLINFDPNPPRSTKCLRHCVMVAHNLYKSDGTLHGSNLKAIYNKVFPNILSDEQLEFIEDTAHKCQANNTDDDRCEKAHGVAMCTISKLTDHGINLLKKP